MLRDEVAFDGDVEECLTILRTKGLSIKELDSKKKEALRMYLDYLHNTKGLSLNDIAKIVGNKTSGYTSWVCRQVGVKPRPFEEARLKGIREKRRKYERKPFDGTDEDKAYLLGRGTGTCRCTGHTMGLCAYPRARLILQWHNCSVHYSSDMDTCIKNLVTRRTRTVTNGIWPHMWTIASDSSFPRSRIGRLDSF